jgi:Protein of unknown function N-terminus (DUF3323)
VAAAGPEAAEAGRLSRTLGDPALARIMHRLARRLKFGRPLEAPLTLTDATEAGRRALSRLLGRPMSLRGKSLRVSPTLLSAALVRAGIAPDLRSAVEALAGPVTSRAEVTAAETAGRAAALAALAAGRHAGTPWYKQWTDSVQADGTLTRIVRSGSLLLVEQAVAVLNELPADMLPLPALAERATPSGIPRWPIEWPRPAGPSWKNACSKCFWPTWPRSELPPARAQARTIKSVRATSLPSTSAIQEGEFCARATPHHWPKRSRNSSNHCRPGKRPAGSASQARRVSQALLVWIAQKSDASELDVTYR